MASIWINSILVIVSPRSRPVARMKPGVTASDVRGDQNRDASEASKPALQTAPGTRNKSHDGRAAAQMRFHTGILWRLSEIEQGDSVHGYHKVMQESLLTGS